MLHIRNKAFISNVMSLYGVQFLSIIIPLAVLPYSARVLEPKAWGALALAQSLAVIISVVVDFGFSVSGPRMIAAHNSNIEYCLSVFLHVNLIKIFIAFVVALLFITLIYYKIFNSDDNRMLYFALVSGILQGMSVFWYFQGHENLAKIAIFNIVARIVLTIPVFLIVKTPADAWIIIFLQVLNYAMSILYGTIVILKNSNRPRFNYNDALHIFRQSYSMFIFKLSTSLYTSFNTIILKFFVDRSYIGYFNAADRLSNITRVSLSPITQILFPKFTKLIQQDYEKARSYLLKSLFILLTLSIIASILSISLSSTLIIWLYGDKYYESIKIFKILALSLPFIAISNVLGIQWMLVNTMDRAFNLITILSSFIGLLSSYITSKYFGIEGVAWGIVFTEFCVSTMMLSYLLNSAKNPFRVLKIMEVL